MNVVKVNFVHLSKKIRPWRNNFVFLFALLLIGCSHQSQTERVNAAFASNSGTDTEYLNESYLKLSFGPSGIATMDRLNQDKTQTFCSQIAYDATHTGMPLVSKNTSKPDLLFESLREANKALIFTPTDLVYFGDYARGEAIAQDGRGKTWTDSADQFSGGNCYNCHQLSKKELSFGTLGPSLYGYGKSRGVTSQAIYDELIKNPKESPLVQYTWGMLVNSKAYNLCTVMPRFGVAFESLKGFDHSGTKAILNERQLQDLMALLLDPNSPVNRE